jgi:hypothetical protein
MGMKFMKNNRKWACDQSLASAKIEGFKPSPAFMKIFGMWRANRLTNDAFRLVETERILRNGNWASSPTLAGVQLDGDKPVQPFLQNVEDLENGLIGEQEFLAREAERERNQA